jgi:hypothetical protein
MVTASNAGAADPAYNPAISYTLGARVYLPSDGRTYECVQAPALGQDPAASPLYWMLAAPSNRWAMWDAEISTATAVEGSLSATVTVPGRFNAVGVFGLVGDAITLVQKSAAGATLWSETRSLKSNPGGWYAYFHEPRVQVRDAVFTGLVPSSGSRLEVHINGGSTACASVVVGTSMSIGETQYGFTSGIASYSRKETNTTTGAQTLRKGRRSKRMSGTLSQPRGQFNAVFAALESLDATPCVWVGAPSSGDYEPLTILGFYRDFQIEVSYPNHNICSLEIEGLT